MNLNGDALHRSSGFLRRLLLWIVVFVIPDMYAQHLAVVGDRLGLVDYKFWIGIKPVVDGAAQEELDSVWFGLGIPNLDAPPLISVTFCK